MTDDRYNPENPPRQAGEAAERLITNFEQVRETAEAMVDRLSEKMKVPRMDVFRLAVVFFGRYLDMTRSGDTIVLVVKGQVKAYESALQVLVAGDEEYKFFDELLVGLDDDGLRGAE